MKKTREQKVLRNYKTRDGRIVPLARVTPHRCYRLLWLHCQECGRGFAAVRSDAVTCGDSCRARRYRRQRRERKEGQQELALIAEIVRTSVLCSVPLYPDDSSH